MGSTFLAGISLCDMRLLMGVTRFGCRIGVGRACSLTSYSGNATAVDFKILRSQCLKPSDGVMDIGMAGK